MKTTKTIMILLLMLIFLIGCGKAVPAVEDEAVMPELTYDIMLDGLERPWGLAELPDGSLLFTERRGVLSVLKDSERVEIAEISDVMARGEGGLLGLAVDIEFEENRFIYVAYNINVDGPEVRVTRFELTEDLVLENAFHIVEGLPAIESGRHSGTQLAMDQEGVLWIGTGDSATAKTPQDPESLGGKILRVTRDGEPAEGNLEAPFDPRIFSYGHRNTQGLLLFAEPIDEVYGYSAEHGSWVDDEVNELVSGNFGWDPLPPYKEDVPMTDLDKFPDAIEAVWSSGERTIAVSGLTQLVGEHWGDFDGALVLGVQKDQHLRVLRIAEREVVGESLLFEREFGRIRGVMMHSDGSLYFATDNGGDDKIVRVSVVDKKDE